MPMMTGQAPEILKEGTAKKFFGISPTVWLLALGAIVGFLVGLLVGRVLEGPHMRRAQGPMLSDSVAALSVIGAAIGAFVGFVTGTVRSSKADK